MIPFENITGLILAGGQSTRMGGVDKGMQLLRGFPMVIHVLLRLAPQVGSVLVSANRNLDAYQELGHTVISDALNDVGPLGGIHMGLSVCNTDYLLVVPCDVPALPTDLVERLGKVLMAQKTDAAMATAGPWKQPLFCLLRVNLRDSLETYLHGGGRKVERWFDSMDVARVAFDDQVEAFRNVNTLEDLRAME